jgi:endogenous inhibitor of DNA gyrase (YacG/DUF329 family)
MTVSKTCPICGKPAESDRAPFCSARCANVDLNRWLKGGYAIPAVEIDEEDESEQPGAVGGDGGHLRH